MTKMTEMTRREKWNLADLKPHPKQAEIFGDLPAAIFEELKQDIETNGLKHPIEVLPDGTILSGHQRRRVLMDLGYTATTVLVRHDLAEAEESEIEDVFLTANTARRQLSPLARIRIEIRRHEIKVERPWPKMYAHQVARLRDHLVESLEMTARNVGRYLAVLRTPRAVQDAFEAERITLQQAAKVATLREEVQGEIAEQLPQAEDPKALVKTFFVANRKSYTVCNQYRSFLVTLYHTIHEIRPQMEFVETVDLEEDVELMEQGIEFFRELIARLERGRREKDEWLASF